MAVPRPREGVCAVAKFFDSALLQSARSVCVSLSAFLFIVFFDQYRRLSQKRCKVDHSYESVIGITGTELIYVTFGDLQ